MECLCRSKDGQILELCIAHRYHQAKSRSELLVAADALAEIVEVVRDAESSVERRAHLASLIEAYEKIRPER